MCQAQGLMAMISPMHRARCLLVPILGRQPGRELEGCPVSARGQKMGTIHLAEGKAAGPGEKSWS